MSAGIDQQWCAQEIAARVGFPRSLLPNGPSGSNDASGPQLKLKDYLVGSQLDDALAAGQDLVVSYPFADGTIEDWVQAEALWCVRSLSSYALNVNRWFCSGSMYPPVSV